MAARGSAKLMRERSIPKAEIDRLWKQLNDDDTVQLVHWEDRGQPNPDVVTGVVKAKPDAIGRLIQSMLELKRLRLRFEVFPHGLPYPDEVLVRFRRGGPGY